MPVVSYALICCPTLTFPQSSLTHTFLIFYRIYLHSFNSPKELVLYCIIGTCRRKQQYITQDHLLKSCLHTGRT